MSKIKGRPEKKWPPDVLRRFATAWNYGVGLSELKERFRIGATTVARKSPGGAGRPDCG